MKGDLRSAATKAAMTNSKKHVGKFSRLKNLLCCRRCYILFLIFFFFRSICFLLILCVCVFHRLSVKTVLSSSHFTKILSQKAMDETERGGWKKGSSERKWLKTWHGLRYTLSISILLPRIFKIAEIKRNSFCNNVIIYKWKRLLGVCVYAKVYCTNVANRYFVSVSVRNSFWAAEAKKKSWTLKDRVQMVFIFIFARKKTLQCGKCYWRIARAVWSIRHFFQLIILMAMTSERIQWKRDRH